MALEGHPEYPHYTRPAEYRGWRVPEVLLSGHHERIEHWRRERSRERGEAPARQRASAGSPPPVRRSRLAVRYHCCSRWPRYPSRGPCRRLTARPLLIVMSSVIETIERAQLRRVPDFAPGDRVKVHFQVIEGTRSRVQVFEGVVIKRQGHGARETFTVRKQSFGVGVERMFPVHSPKIERIELAARGDVRRAKLYYLRDRVGKRARVRERRYTGPEETSSPACCTSLTPLEPTEATDAEGMTAQETLEEAVRRRGRRTASRSTSRARGASGSEPEAETATARLTRASRRRQRSLLRCRRRRGRRSRRRPAGVSTAAKTAKKRSKSTRSSLVELVVIIAVALGLALGIQAFIVKPYRIPSGSMEPTLAIGQRVLVNRIGMDFSEPHVGEIVVFHPPEGAEQEDVRPDAPCDQARRRSLRAADAASSRA